MADALITAVALVLVIEGAVYALFPEAMKRMILQVAAQPSASLRSAGLFAAIVGVGILWLLQA